MSTPQKPRGYWKQSAKLLAEQAKTLSNNQLAALHNTTNSRMRCQQTRLEIKPSKHVTGREARNAELAKLATTLVANMPRNYKADFGSELRRRCMALVMRTYDANTSQDRAPILQRIRQEV